MTYGQSTLESRRQQQFLMQMQAKSNSSPSYSKAVCTVRLGVCQGLMGTQSGTRTARNYLASKLTTQP